MESTCSAFPQDIKRQTALIIFTNLPSENICVLSSVRFVNTEKMQLPMSLVVSQFGFWTGRLFLQTRNVEFETCECYKERMRSGLLQTVLNLVLELYAHKRPKCQDVSVSAARKLFNSCLLGAATL